MERITERQLSGLVNRTNLLLPASRAVYLQGENGGWTIYLRDAEKVGSEPKAFVGSGVRKSLTHGTKRECWDYLQAFVEGLYTIQEA